MNRPYTTILFATIIVSFLSGSSLAQQSSQQSASAEHYSKEQTHRIVDLSVSNESQLLANEQDFMVRLVPSPTALLKLLIANQTNTPLTISLTNAQREQLYQSGGSSNQTWGWWKLDVSNLPDGTYTLHVRAGKRHLDRTFTLETRQPVVYAQDRVVIFE